MMLEFDVTANALCTNGGGEGGKGGRGGVAEVGTYSLDNLTKDFAFPTRLGSRGVVVGM